MGGVLGESPHGRPAATTWDLITWVGYYDGTYLIGYLRNYMKKMDLIPQID